MPAKRPHGRNRASKLYRVCHGAFGHVSALELTGERVAHVHSSANISLWLSGAAAQLGLDDAPVGRDAGSAALINSLVPHSLKIADANGPAQTLPFYLDPDWLARILAAHLPADFARLAVEMTPEMRAELWRLADMPLDECADGVELECALMAFLHHALGATRAPEEPARPRAPRDFRLRKAVSPMHENMPRDLDMETVARASGLSQPHVFSIFRDQLALTPAIFWNAPRLEGAVHEMRDTGESLTAVASHLGFTAQGNFTCFFRQHTGVAPSADRCALERDLAACAVQGRNSSGATHDGRGANVPGDPRIAIAWLANELSAHGVALREGEFVTTGACIAPIPVGPGDVVTGDYGAFGTIQVRFEA